MTAQNFEAGIKVGTAEADFWLHNQRYRNVYLALLNEVYHATTTKWIGNVKVSLAADVGSMWFLIW